MKAAWVDLKNQNEHSFIGKKKHKDEITATTKLAYNKVKIVAVNIVKVFLKMISLLIKKRQQSLVILAAQTKIMKIIFLQIYQLIWWTLRMMVKTVVDRVVDSGLADQPQLLFQYQYNFLPLTLLWFEKKN